MSVSDMPAPRAVASSLLVKSAVHGSDPNWGRVIAAAGRSGGLIDESKVNFYINDVVIMEAGRPIPFHKDSVVVIMCAEENPARCHRKLLVGAALEARGVELRHIRKDGSAGISP